MSREERLMYILYGNETYDLNMARKINSIVNDNYVLLEGIDKDSLYHGVIVAAVSSEDLPTDLVAIDTTTHIKTLFLPIAQKVLGAVDNLYANDGLADSDTEKARVYGLKYLANDIGIKINDTRNDYSNQTQSLSVFLRDNYIIDDGEVV